MANGFEAGNGNGKFRTRNSDNWLYRWIPFLFTVVTTSFLIGIAWQNVKSFQEYTSANNMALSSSLNALADKVNKLNEDSIVIRLRFEQLDSRITQLETNKEVLIKISQDVGELRGDFKRALNSIQRLWNLSRANQGNITTLSHEIEQLTNDRIKLRDSRADPNDLKPE